MCIRDRVWFVVLLAVGVPLVALALYVFGGVSGLLGQGSNVLIVASAVFGAAALMRWRTGSPIIAVALPSFVFAFAHIYEIWGMLSVASMALVAAWLVWRTGGLEAAITLHVVNNIVGFLTVSYTHLDVYKRQGQRRTLRALRDRTGRWPHPLAHGVSR